MAWDVEFTDDFGEWWDGLTAEEQDSVADSVYVLLESGPALTRPQADTIRGSKYHNMRELRIQHQGRPYRVLYAFDPRRVGVLLIVGTRPETTAGMKSSCRRPPPSIPSLERNREGLGGNNMARKWSELEAKMGPER